MPLAASLPSSVLDIPTLSFVAISLAALLGLFLILSWLQERDVRALAWWGAAYLIGASSVALWTVPGAFLPVPQEIPAALIFVACGMVWNGVRLFQGRRILPLAIIGGAMIWLSLGQLPAVAAGANLRIAIGAVIVAGYTFFIAFELRRERRKSLYSRAAAIIVPALHAVIFLSPIGIRAFLPLSMGQRWIDVFALETMVYAVGAAFIVLLMVKDHHVHIQRHAASTDPLTGLLNRRAFLDGARALRSLQGRQREAVTLLMFDLDHFKSINDTFGHAVGDDVLRLFATSIRSSMRANDIVGRIGGEEFAAIVPASLGATNKIAERIRASFERVGAIVGEHATGVTVSIGTACAPEAETDIEELLARADVALYRAKADGRNRVRTWEDEPPPDDATRLIAAARASNAVRLVPRSRPEPAETYAKPVLAEAATSRLLYRR
jgi:diguanylate cyclase (GGDEF)-like protein